MLQLLKITSSNRTNFIREIQIDESAPILDLIEVVSEACSFRDVEYYTLDIFNEKTDRIKTYQINPFTRNKNSILNIKCKDVLKNIGYICYFTFDTITGREIRVHLIDQLDIKSENCKTPIITYSYGEAPLEREVNDSYIATAEYYNSNSEEDIESDNIKKLIDSI